MSDNPDSTIIEPPDDDPTRFIRRDTVQQLQVGDVLRDRFVIERKLGEGGMGQVFLARDGQAEKSNPYVALKVLGATFKDHPQAFKALRREATQSRTLTHPNIVAVFDFDRSGDHVYMVMEYLKGHSLDDVIRIRPEGGKLKEVWPVIEGIARGLEYVHQKNIVHADVKPGNVFVTDDGDVKVLDLGIARTLNESQAAAGTTRFDPDALGALTPQYASPEMFEGQAPRPQDDIFALGCIAYELLSGKHPYDRKTAIEARSMRLVPKRPPGLGTRQWKVLKASLAMQRADRPATVTEFIRAMSPHGSSMSPWPWIAVAALLAGVLGSQYFLGRGTSDEKLINDLLERYAFDISLLADENDVYNWENQATFFSEIGASALAEGDIDRAVQTLLDGSSSAVRAYELVMMRSNDPERRRASATNMLRLLRQVHAEALAMEVKPNSAPDRLKLVCAGLKAMDEPGLTKIFAELVDEDVNAVQANPACARLLELSLAR